jgi:hypothetical protein
MLFLITQTHTAESCPVDAGGSKALYDAKAEGVKLRGVYGAYAEHIIYYLVEADTLQAVHRFLLPGFQRCTREIRPVSEEPVVK